MKIRMAGARASARKARTSLALKRAPMTLWRRSKPELDEVAEEQDEQQQEDDQVQVEEREDDQVRGDRELGARRRPARRRLRHRSARGRPAMMRRLRLRRFCSLEQRHRYCTGTRVRIVGLHPRSARRRRPSGRPRSSRRSARRRRARARRRARPVQRAGRRQLETAQLGEHALGLAQILGQVGLALLALERRSTLYSLVSTL